MMSGYLSCPGTDPRPRPRTYGVVARDGGWSVSLGDMSTRPFADREAAERIAAQLQRQADGLRRSDGAATRGLRVYQEGL